jgi:hypothetical protein
MPVHSHTSLNFLLGCRGQWYVCMYVCMFCGKLVLMLFVDDGMFCTNFLMLFADDGMFCTSFLMTCMWLTACSAQVF